MKGEIKNVKFVDSPPASPTPQEWAKMKRELSDLKDSVRAIAIVAGGSIGVTLLYFFTH